MYQTFNTTTSTRNSFNKCLAFTAQRSVSVKLPARPGLNSTLCQIICSKPNSAHVCSLLSQSDSEIKFLNRQQCSTVASVIRDRCRLWRSKLTNHDYYCQITGNWKPTRQCLAADCGGKYVMETISKYWYAVLYIGGERRLHQRLQFVHVRQIQLHACCQHLRHSNTTHIIGELIFHIGTCEASRFRFGFESNFRFGIRFVVMIRFEIFESSAPSIVLCKETIGGG